MHSQQPEVDEFGLYAPNHVSGPSSLDYEDADFPITGAVTTAESAPHFNAEAWAWLTAPVAMEGGADA